MLQLEEVTKIYSVGATLLHAVQNVSLTLQKNEIFCLVGESGCGKSTLARLLLRLLPPTSGRILLKGKDIAHQSRKSLSTQVQMIFQNPYSSLNPRMRVRNILQEPLQIHRRPCRTEELLDLVGLPRYFQTRFPHELSGGQRQRIAIARAISLCPDLIVCDEPTSALDVSTQAQILDLLMRLAKEYGLTYLFITHNLAIARSIAARIGIMHAGRIVESGLTESVYTSPLHPYTKMLLSSAL